ncbi:Myb-like_DNA-binding domain-containing protein [Hexamita inflata]|uniref:Myb-like DNA-binding domain-containing protein n=1 Tax=Hexamita inflata TaxID=28002 RepID=A0AA86QLZ1_9EUKA|nr:Myb-like DNA-binding domain-containing protein [Hexamita inflata]
MQARIEMLERDHQEAYMRMDQILKKLQNSMQSYSQPQQIQPAHNHNKQVVEDRTIVNKQVAERWTDADHHQFLEAFMLYGKNNAIKISQKMGSRTSKQVASHQQKFLKKIAMLKQYTIADLKKVSPFPLELIQQTQKYITLTEGSVMTPMYEQCNSRQTGVYPQQAQLDEKMSVFGSKFAQMLPVMPDLLNEMKQKMKLTLQSNVKRQILDLFATIVINDEPYFFAVFYVAEQTGVSSDIIASVIFEWFWM